MDDRTGQLYDSKEAALLCGVPEKHVHEVEATIDTITVLDGPFKGRCYERMADGKRGRRRRDLEVSQADEAARIARIAQLEKALTEFRR